MDYSTGIPWELKHHVAGFLAAQFKQTYGSEPKITWEGLFRPRIRLTAITMASKEIVEVHDFSEALDQAPPVPAPRSRSATIIIFCPGTAAAA
jgi:hypothetical protein